MCTMRMRSRSARRVFQRRTYERHVTWTVVQWHDSERCRSNGVQVEGFWRSLCYAVGLGWWGEINSEFDDLLKHAASVGASRLWQPMLAASVQTKLRESGYGICGDG